MQNSVLDLKTHSTAAGLDLQVWLKAGVVATGIDLVLAYDFSRATWLSVTRNPAAFTGWYMMSNFAVAGEFYDGGFSFSTPLNSGGADLLLETISFSVTESSGFSAALVKGTGLGYNSTALVMSGGLPALCTLIETDAALTATGVLGTSSSGTPLFVARSNVAGDNGYGSFGVTTSGVWSYTANTAHNEFVASHDYTDTFFAASADGKITERITVTIAGTNDAPTVLGALTSNVSEGYAAYTLNLLGGASDADGGTLTLGTLTYMVDGAPTGNLARDLPSGVTLSGTGLRVNPSDALFDHLALGQHVTIVASYTISDGQGGLTAQTATVAIAGTNDPAVISGTSSVSLTETDIPLTATGTLTSTDVDGTANLFVAQTDVAGNHGFGTFSMTSGGVWSYLADSAHSEFVGGQHYTDSFTVTAADGTPQAVTVTIAGTDDLLAPTLTSCTPGDGAADVAIGSDIVLHFSEAIQTGGAAIAIHSGSANGPVVGSSATISGSTLTINPADDLLNGTHYFVTLADGSIEDAAGNHFVDSGTYDFTTVIATHEVGGGAIFWKTGEAITGVTTSLASVPAPTQLVEFRNIQLLADGSRTIEIWETSTKSTIDSVRLEFALPAGSVAAWQSAAGLSGWITASNAETPGQFIFGGMGFTPLSAGPVKLGTLTLTAPAIPDHFELILSAGDLDSDTVSPFGIAFDTMTTGSDGHYQSITMNEGTYTLSSAKVASTAEISAVDANDALAALKMAVGLNPNLDGSAISPYQYLAADINRDGFVKSADALNILRMAVHLETAPASEWIFVPDSVGSESMTRSHVVWPDNPLPLTLEQDHTLQLIGIVKGDVDGSWALTH